MSEVPLEQLYRAFLDRGDEAALEQWMRRSSPPLRRLARRLGASAEDAEDLVQETFVAAIQAGDRFDPTRPLLPWLKGILTFRAARLARDELRRRRHYEVHHRQRDEAASDADPDLAELHDDVRRAIDDLPERYREPLLQHLLAQRSPLEIAQQLGVERATVRTHLHRGLQRLRDALRRWAAPLLLYWFGRRANAASRLAAGAAMTALLVVMTAVLVRLTWPASSTTDVASGADTDLTTNLPSAPVTQQAVPHDEPEAARVAAATSTAEFVAIVRDAAGAPVPQVGVSIAAAAGLDPVLHRRTAVTDATGTVRFATLPSGSLQVRLDRGPSQLMQRVADEPLAHSFVLADAPMQLGTVVDPSGAPVADAEVWLAEPGPDGALRGQVVATSDAAGRFALAALPRGSRLAARHQQFARGEVVTCDSDTLQLPLGPRGGRLTVRVLDADDRPVRDALVFVGDAADAAPLVLAQGAAPQRLPPCVARSDADGEVHTMALHAGPVPVFVRAVGCAPFRTVAEVRVDASDTCIVRLQPGGTIDGVVRDPDGAALTAAVAFRCDDDAASIDLRTDADGRFTLDCLPPGDGMLALDAPGCVASVLGVVLRPGTRHPATITLQRTRRLDGRVTCCGLPPPAGTELRAEWLPSALRPSRQLTEADAEGRFVLDDAFGELPRLRVRLPGEPLWRDGSALWNGEHVELALPAGFAADSWITGTAHAADGSPVGDARLFVERDGVEWAEVARADADGNYRIGPLPPGDYRLFAESTRRDCPTVVGAPVHLDAHSTQRCDLHAAPTGELLVELRRDDGAPVGDVLMTLQRADLARRFAMAEAPTMRQTLEAGDYVLAVMGRRVEWLEALPVHVTAGAETPVVVTLRAACDCRLAVRNLPGSAARTPRTLRLFDLQSPTAEPRTYTLLPDAPPHLGAVLPLGRYRLTCRNDDGVVWSGEFAVTADDGARTIPVTLLPQR